MLLRPQVPLEWPLESVAYVVRSPRQHELRPPPGGPAALSLHFPDLLEAQQWAALIRGATAEGQSDGKSSCPGLAACPVSTPAPFRATPPKVAASYSSTDLVGKEELAGRLAHAIAVGDTQGAGEAAAILARQHAALKVWLQEASFTAGPIRLQVTVEDVASSARVVLQVHPHHTVAALQEQVFSELGFPPAVQCWVIGKRLCVPELSLASYGVWQDGDPAFLYLLSAPQEAAGPSPPHPQKCGELGHWLPQLLQLPQAPQLVNSSLPSPLQPGWSCPSCTFINLVSRPSCEMCGTQRPCAWDSHPSPKVARREGGLSLQGPQPLDSHLNPSGNPC